MITISCTGAKKNKITILYDFIIQKIKKHHHFIMLGKKRDLRKRVMQIHLKP